MKCSRRNGFNMAELLVVVAVIIILLSLSSAGLRHGYMRAKQLQCQNNLEHLGYLCLIWSIENDGRELAAVDTSTGQTLLWYRALAPYISETGAPEETAALFNCSLMEWEVAAGEGQQEPWARGTDILFAYDRYRSWFDFIDVVEDLREAGWPGTIHMLERNPVQEQDVFNPITPHIENYGIFSYFDAWWRRFTSEELAAVKRFQENRRGIFISADHHASFTQVNNQLADYCGWGLYNWGNIDRGNDGQPFRPVSSHPIGAGFAHFRGYSSEGQIQIPSDPSLRNPYASLVLFSGLPGPGPDDAIAGVVDDGKFRLVMEANWTKFANPSWYYRDPWRESHLHYLQNIYYWLLERSADTTRLSYGYNSQIGGLDPATGRPRPRPVSPAQVIRILDYEDSIADQGGPEAGDPEYFVALRHGGRANVLFMDGRVEALYLEDILCDDMTRWKSRR